MNQKNINELPRKNMSIKCETTRVEWNLENMRQSVHPVFHGVHRGDWWADINPSGAGYSAGIALNAPIQAAEEEKHGGPLTLTRVSWWQKSDGRWNIWLSYKTAGGQWVIVSKDDYASLGGVENNELTKEQ